jgi:hypothetical protein
MPVIPTRDRVDPETVKETPLRRPEWIKVRAPSGETYEHLQTLMRSKLLHTVCEEAMCPNMGECWWSGTATFLMLVDVCTRTCGFCDIKHGRPEALDWMEPERVAQAVKSMNLKHAVITGQEGMRGQSGIARTDINPTGQVQSGAELWTAELAEGQGRIRKGENVEVVKVEGLTLRVKKRGT